MSAETTVFLCYGISSDANRAQFNRVRFLCQTYPVYILANYQVSQEASRNAKMVKVFSREGLWIRPLYFLWVIWSLLEMKRQGLTPGRIYCTYEPPTLVLAFIVSRLFQLEWIADLWDDPEKMLMHARVHARQYRILNLAVKKIDFLLCRMVLRRADKVILGLVPEPIIFKYRLAREKVLPITNGINFDYSFPVRRGSELGTQGQFRIFYCGPIEPVRLEGFPRFLEIVSKNIPSPCIELVGPDLGGGVDWLCTSIKALDHRICLEISGTLPYGDVLERIARSDVCVCPYPDKMDFSTAFPVKVFDYMVMGKAIVASGLAGTKVILVHDKSALLFLPGNYEQMAEYVLRLHESRDLRNCLGDEARKAVNSFSWDRINSSIQKFLAIEESAC